MIEFGSANKTLYKLANIFKQAGFQCYLVGGAVRSHLLNKPIKDYDITTDAKPREITQLINPKAQILIDQEIWGNVGLISLNHVKYERLQQLNPTRKGPGKVFPTGIKHGTVTVMIDEQKFEITTFRSEGSYSDGRHPDSIAYATNIDEDLTRRDFTINSMAYDLINNKLYDPNLGRTDLDNKLIKAIGLPSKRFREDGLRPLRALRFVAQLNFKLDQTTYEAIRANLAITNSVSKERVAEEFKKLCLADNAEEALELMRDCGLITLFFKQLNECCSISHSNAENLLDHQIKTLSFVPVNYKNARLAALFHDIGKTQALATGDSHTSVGAKIMKDIAKEYHFTTAETNKLVPLVENHNIKYTGSWSDAKVRRLLSRLAHHHIDYNKKNENIYSKMDSLLRFIEELMALNKANLYATAGKVIDTSFDELESRIRQICYTNPALFVSDLAVNGHDLLKQGLKGHAIGETLNYLLDRVIDEPKINHKENLLKLIAES